MLSSDILVGGVGERRRNIVVSSADASGGEVLCSFSAQIVRYALLRVNRRNSFVLSAL